MRPNLRRIWRCIPRVAVVVGIVLTVGISLNAATAARVSAQSDEEKDRPSLFLPFVNRLQDSSSIPPPNGAEYDYIVIEEGIQVPVSFLYPRANWRFVNIAYTGGQSGTFRAPYQQLATGISNTPSSGTLWVQPGVYSGVHTFNKPMTIQAPLGGVTLR